MKIKRDTKTPPSNQFTTAGGSAGDDALRRDAAAKTGVENFVGGSGSIEGLSLLADTMPQIVWITRVDGFHEFYNRRWWDYTGLTPDQAAGAGWISALHPDDVDRAAASWRAALASGELYEIEYRLRRASDGEYRWFLGRALPYRDAGNQIVRWFGTCTDIHDRKVAEQALSEAKAELEKVSKSKDEFLSVLSHELRTPLSAILGWVQLLEMGVLDPTEQSEALATIKEQAKAQSQLIEDLLEVSRIVNGKFHMRDEAVEMHLVVRGAVESIRAMAKTKGVAIETGSVDPSLFIRGDPQRLQQLAANLLSNGVKFTPPGGKVTIGLERIHQHALLTVSDTGRGMSDEMIGRLFSRFQQADGSVNRTQSGLGLGLAIAKHIVEGHHGTIEAKSDGVDRGSTFTVQLPVQAIRPDDYNASVPERLASLANALRDRSVLLVDDEESARTIVTACLQRAGARVTVTQSVAEAWEQLLQRQFDVLISDVGMPHESGYDLIRRLRQSDLPARSLPSLALTAFASIDDQTNAKRAGFDVYLTKPVEPLELIHRVAVLLDSAKPAAN